MARFVGRSRELKKLKNLLGKDSASFVIIRGRRRIGKSRLIQEFGKSIPCHLFSGLPPDKMTTKQGQLQAFSSQVEKAFQTPPLNPNDWGTMFWHLAKYCGDGPIMIALDEISWIGSKDSNFLGELKNAWDLHFSHNPKLILIVCGSVSSWITKNILSSTGFVGRISLDMRLRELPLSDAVKFWGSLQERVSAHEILQMLSVTGGVPRYLEEINPKLPSEENIRQLCFEEEGLLYREFDQIFSDLFNIRATIYANIAKLLATGAKQLNEIATSIEKSNARTSVYLQDLIQAGFVTEDPTWNLHSAKSSRLRHYRLSDNYVRFYLKYVMPNKDRIQQRAFEATRPGALPEWEGVMGLQFENVVHNNVHALLPHLGLTASDLMRFGPFFQRSTNRQSGCQIDLLIQTLYRTVYICEIKFSKGAVGMDAVHQIEKACKTIALPRGWSYRSALIHVNGVTPDVKDALTLDYIVDFSELLSEERVP